MLRRILNLAPNNSAGGGVAAPPSPTSVGQPSSAPKPGGNNATPASVPPGSSTPPASSSTPPADKGMFDELDAMVAPAPKTTTEPPKTPPATTTPKPGDKSPEPKPDATPGTPATPQQAMGPKQLREYANRKEAEAKAAADKVADLERKLAEKERLGQDTTALTEKLAAAEKRQQEVEKQLYALNVGESPEFKKSYIQPFNEAAEYAKETVEKLEVITGRDEDTGEATTTRQASWNDDFIPIYQLSRQSITKATQQAKALFGDSAQTVMNHVQELHRLERAKNKAFADHQANAETERQARTAEEAKQKEWFNDAWSRVNNDVAEKNPTIFQPDPQDKQRAEIFSKSLQLVDSRHNNKALSPLQSVTLEANVRLRAAAFPVLQYDLNKAKEKIAELEAQIQEMMDGKPGDTQRPGGDSTQKTPEKSFSQELAELQA